MRCIQLQLLHLDSLLHLYGAVSVTKTETEEPVATGTTLLV
jgi:hypothetical protein